MRKLVVIVIPLLLLALYTEYWYFLGHALGHKAGIAFMLSIIK